MSTLTDIDRNKIAEFVNTHHLSSGLGTEEEACTVAAINLSLYGRLTDEIPECMSYVIGRWIIGVQDSMPNSMRNDVAWKSLIPIAAGTGRAPDAERERLQVIIEWMTDKVLPIRAASRRPRRVRREVGRDVKTRSGMGSCTSRCWRC